MSIFADAVQPFAVRGLIGLKGPIASPSLPDLITAKSGIGYYLDFDNEGKVIILDFGQSETIPAAVANDASRFSCASFQSIASLAVDLSESGRVAWSMVKLYYSAFYAGHAFIRLLGESCSNFTRTHTERIIELGKIFDKTATFNINVGMYRCVIDPGARILRCVQARGSSGGPHQAFWGTFGDYLRALSNAILEGPLSREEALIVTEKLDRLNSLISGGNAQFFHWLSMVRNELQYRHQHNVWFPSTLRKRDRAYLSRLCAEWVRDPVEIDLSPPGAGTLSEFVVACTFIVALCLALLKRIAALSGPRSFVLSGPFAFLRSVGM